MTDSLYTQSHRRLNRLTGEWVLVSPHRTKRPWQGQNEKISEAQRPSYDEGCYLCPGNTRASGDVNPTYSNTYVFENDFAAIQEDITSNNIEEGLLTASSERGVCKVICFSPRHDLTLPEMTVEDIQKVIHLWRDQYLELGALDFVNHVQIFENKGAVMGCSNPHPHGQIWAQESIPMETAKKSKNQLAYFEEHHKTLLSDYLTQELALRDRVLFENDHMVVMVPFWAVWPFETMIIPKRATKDISQLTEDEVVAFAEAIQWITIRYDNLFEVSFPYSSGIHQAPTDGNLHPEWHWHMSFYPPLLRSATVKKFMVGYEMFGNPQRDITPEQAAEKLRDVSGVHYKKR